ncbi:MAG: anion permease [Gudongella sp.]|nr:anion permease [Gudongella sp.]
MNTKLKKRIASLFLPLLIVLALPFGISFSQAIVLSTLIFTLTVWTFNLFSKAYTSFILIVIFIIFGNTPVERILFFPLSSDFFLILLAFLFSDGVIKSGLIQKLIKPYINLFVTSALKFLFLIVFLTTIMIFIIPQPFARLIFISILLNEVMTDLEFEKKKKGLFLFSTYIISMFTNNFFVKGDIVLNKALIQISGISISESQWIEYFFVPTFAMLVLTLIIFLFLYKNDIKIEKTSNKITREYFNTSEKWSLFLISIVFVLWSLEGVLKIPGVFIILLGVFILYIRRFLKFQDLKNIDWGLMVFLTATFAIGPAMSGSGIANILFGYITPLFPNTMSFFLLLAIVLSTIVIHMFLGSLVTTLSVVIPGLAIITSGVIPELPMALLVFVAIFAHFILPFHNVILVIGEGYGFFDSKPVIRFGFVATFITLIGIFFFFIPWWRFIGVL